MRFLPRAVLVAVLGSALPGAGAAGELDGEWCHPDWGIVLFWEEASLGMGEHRMCDWEAPPAGRAEFETTLFCRGIYFQEHSTIEYAHKTHDFKAKQISATELQVQFNQDAPVIVTRCDH